MCLSRTAKGFQCVSLVFEGHFSTMKGWLIQHFRKLISSVSITSHTTESSFSLVMQQLGYSATVYASDGLNMKTSICDASSGVLLDFLLDRNIAISLSSEFTDPRSQKPTSLPEDLLKARPLLIFFLFVSRQNCFFLHQHILPQSLFICSIKCNWTPLIVGHQ